MTPDEERSMHANAEAWCKRYELLCWHFEDDEAREYAEEMSQIAERRKDAMQRSPHEIKQEMRLLAHLESLVSAIRGLVVIATFFLPAFLLGKFLPDQLKERIPTLAWVAAALLAGWIGAAVVGFHRFWQSYLDVL